MNSELKAIAASLDKWIRSWANAVTLYQLTLNSVCPWFQKKVWGEKKNFLEKFAKYLKAIIPDIWL